jgi:hypothetical protein
MQFSRQKGRQKAYVHFLAALFISSISPLFSCFTASQAAVSGRFPVTHP